MEHTATTTTMSVDASGNGYFAGNLGVGTTSPANTLDVYGTNGIHIQSGVPTSTSMALYNNSGTLTWNGISLATGASVSGTTNYLPVFTGVNSLGNSVIYQSGGNLGIGTTSPLASLDLSRKTDAVLLPVGTTGAQPTCNGNTTGGIRYNSSTGYPEYCSGSAWIPFKVTGAPPGSGYFVLTSGTYNGNLGSYASAGGSTGLAAGNAICLSELSTNTGWWGYATANAAGLLNSSHVFAFLCDGSSCSTPAANTTLYYANDSIAWTLGYRWGGAGTTSGVAWTGRGTGSNTAWPVSSSSTCTGWTSSSSGLSGTIAQPSFSDYHRWGSAVATCDQARRLICYVNP